MADSTQGLYFLPTRKVDIHPDTGAYSRKVVETYTYAFLVASWEGSYKGQPGMYFVLGGDLYRRNSTIDRMATGLYFAHFVMELE